MRPLLRWAGSKRQMLGPLREMLPREDSIYIEPFCGSAALFFDQRPKRAVLSDINADLINFYAACKSRPRQVFRLSGQLKRTKAEYLKIRKHSPAERSKIARAAYFYYLNRNCFNGLYRTNRQGMFNVPFSASRTGRMLSEEEFLSACAALKSARVVSCDFERLIKENLEPEAFFFLDPPYAVKHRQPFTDYNSQAFGESDLQRLLVCLKAIDDVGAKFAITYDSSVSEKFMLRKRWRQSEIIVRRNIAGFADARRNASEILTTNF
ncbi:DNA adenine methylase [Tardiphaga sp. 862_B3_N1_1]|uniref:DNA adenine methylase n=1 Tax=Tardiphaga sp. 862_B3_N1_1 TaxID=3240763 RepID=UPI003F89E743